MKLLILLLAVQVWAQTDYSGYKVYRLTPETEEDVERLWRLKEQYDSMIDFWHEPASAGSDVDIMVAPTVHPILRTRLDRLFHAAHASLLVDDVQELIQQERSNSPDLHFLDSYNRYDEIVSWLQNVCVGNCNLVNIGESYEQRDMYVAQIGGDDDKPILFFECGIHAREHVSPAVCINIINRLVVEGDDEMLQTYNFHIITNSNPDGYEYTFTDNRMWRKTRSVNSGSSCFGCDPNRNFAYEFGGAGTSNNPCSDIYRGPSAFSEAETENIRAYVTPRSDSIRAYYSVHSYGQYFLIPWSYARNQYPVDFDDMLAVADVGAAAILAQSGLTYRAGQSADLLGATAGCSDDWAKGSLGIKFAYTIELRDTGRYGFLLPDTEIQPNFEEIWASLEAMVVFMRDNYPGPN